jgi:hypothetical protein
MPEPNEKKIEYIMGEGAIHRYFELSYAQYLTIPRTVLQSMPLDWQESFVSKLEEIEEYFPGWLRDGECYFVELHHGCNEDDPVIPDRLADYERGRRRLTPAIPIKPRVPLCLHKVSMDRACKPCNRKASKWTGLLEK